MSQHPLEELNRYDAKANAEYYGRRPWLAIGRIFKIIYFALSFGLAFGWDVLTGNTVSQPKLAERLRQIITALGPTYIKVGQALSTRPDLVRVDFLEELTKLQDQLPPFSNTEAFEIIESELGKPVQTVYRNISEDPVAAASLGQVYKATLYSGEEVAVKVQRPNLIPTLTLDLFILRLLAGWVSPILPLNLGNSLEAIVDEFGLKLFEEIF